MMARTKKSMPLLVFLSVFLFSAVHAATVVVKPGKFDHFTLQVPERILAGETFTVKAQIYDANNNLITNFSESGKEFKVMVAGAAVVQQPHLGPTSFPGGVANIILNNKKAETFVFSISEVTGTVPIVSKEITILPNRLDHFVVQAPSAVTAGVSFDTRIIAEDTFGNTVRDSEMAGKSIKISSTGALPIKVLSPSVPDFRNGNTTVNIAAEKIGTVSIEVQELSTGSRGLSQGIVVNPAALSSFKLSAPREAVAGEPFEVVLMAYDAYGNPVNNYAATGSGISVLSTGSSKIEPSFVKAAEFKNNEAVVKVVYEKAEEIQVIAREHNKNQEGRSNVLRVTPSAVNHFTVITPDTAVSGQPFKIKLEAYDRFNNTIRNYNLIGSTVLLKTSGSGQLSPSSVSPAEFRDGVALAEAIYDRAESFSISAVPSTQRIVDVKPRETRASERAETEKAREIEQPRREEKQRVETPPPPPSIPVRPVPAERPREAEKVAMPPPPPAVVAPRAEPEPPKVPAEPQVQKKTVLKEKEAPKPKEEPAKAKKEVAEKKPAEKKEKVPAKEEKPVVKEEKKAAPRAEPKKKEQKETLVAKKQVETPKPPAKETKANGKGLFSLNNISIIEAKDKAMVVLTTATPDGQMDYRDEIESKQGSDWLKIRMKPAVVKTERSLRFKSDFVGEVISEEDKKDKDVVNVYIQLLPSKVTYDIARVKNSLIVTVAKP